MPQGRQRQGFRPVPPRLNAWPGAKPKARHRAGEQRHRRRVGGRGHVQRGAVVDHHAFGHVHSRHHPQERQFTLPNWSRGLRPPSARTRRAHLALPIKATGSSVESSTLANWPSGHALVAHWEPGMTNTCAAGVDALGLLTCEVWMQRDGCRVDLPGSAPKACQCGPLRGCHRPNGGDAVGESPRQRVVGEPHPDGRHAQRRQDAARGVPMEVDHHVVTGLPNRPNQPAPILSL